jgi:phosphoenolpyruvate---glycerone phosphotransferase subunit DhaL
MTVTGDQVTGAFARVCARLHSVAPELNTLDGRLGDGDLGATLDKCASGFEATLGGLAGRPTDVFRRASLACASASGSSFGTLLAVALLTAAKETATLDGLTRADIVRVIEKAGRALSERGGAKLGDKTVLDPLNAVGCALERVGDGDDCCAAARAAVDATLDAFRGRPNQIGRARMFAAQSIGLDDPGMVAFRHMVQSL